MPHMTWYCFPALDVIVVPFPPGHTEDGVLLGPEELLDVLGGLGAEDVVDWVA